jgi:hypothetical protein
MKKEDLLLLLLALLLLMAMLFTLLSGQGRSRHGYNAGLSSPYSWPSLENGKTAQLPPPDPALHIVDLGIALPRQIGGHLGAA